MDGQKDIPPTAQRYKHFVVTNDEREIATYIRYMVIEDESLMISFDLTPF